MDFRKRTAALALTAALLAGCLTACGTGGEKPGSSPAPSDPAAGTDVIKQTTGLDRDEVLFTLDGDEITAEEYLYWAAFVLDSLVDNYFGSPEQISWDDEFVAQYVASSALQSLSIYRQAENYAGENGIALTPEEEQTRDEDIRLTLESFGGGDAALAEQVLSMSVLTREGLEELVNRFYIYEAVRERMFGPEGLQPVTGEDINAYLEENGIYRAKHILQLTMDMTTREKLDEATIAAKKAAADDMLAQLRASDTPLTLFDELMNAHSEDSGLAANPDGYTTQTGKMVASFENTALALEIGEISEVVESEYGYHIILRLAVDEEAYRAKTEAAKMQDLLTERIEGQTVEGTRAFEDLDLQEFYTKLTNYRTAVSESVNGSGQ